MKTLRGFVGSNPGNPYTNYAAFPVQALHELLSFIAVYAKTLPNVTTPAFVVQARGDTTVRPESAQFIYDELGSQIKHLVWKDIDQHVIVSDEFPEVHDEILTFLRQHQSAP